MRSLRLVDPELEARKRALRQEIARLRQRIEGDSVGVRQAGAELLSWRTHAERHPMWVLAGGFLVGLLAAGGVSFRGTLMRMLGRFVEASLLAQADNFLASLVAAWRNASSDETPRG